MSAASPFRITRLGVRTGVKINDIKIALYGIDAIASMIFQIAVYILHG